MILSAAYGWRLSVISTDFRGGVEPNVVSVVSTHSPFSLSRIVLLTFTGPAV